MNPAGVYCRIGNMVKEKDFLELSFMFSIHYFLWQIIPVVHIM